MVGYGVNKGIIPMVCGEMFRTVEKAEAGKKYQVTTTMLEASRRQETQERDICCEQA